MRNIFDFSLCVAFEKHLFESKRSPFHLGIDRNPRWFCAAALKRTEEYVPDQEVLQASFFFFFFGGG